MDIVAEPLTFIWSIRFALEKGQSLRSAVQDHLEMAHPTLFRRQIHQWWLLKEKGESTSSWMLRLNNPYRIGLFSILDRGWQGQPILQSLNELEKEFMQVTDNDLACHLQKLPVIGLLPLLLFQFPSFMALLMGPLLKQLMTQMGAM